MNKAKYVNFVTPRGVAKYPKLDQPYVWDQGANRSVPSADGQYETLLLLPEDQAKVLVKSIKDAIEQSGITPTHVPYKKEVDKETKKPTGMIEFKFKAYGKSKDGSKNVLKFFDAKAKPAPGLKLTSGSEIKIDGYVSVAKMGARLNIRQIQVLSLVETPSSFAAEEGFEYDDTVETNNKNNAFDETADESFDF
jgi:hypothetical protein